MIMLRELNTIQKREKLNEVYAVDDKGNGGANHRYVVYVSDNNGSPITIQFQNGARTEPDSTSGIIDTDLLEIVRDRLKGFQQGEFATRENAIALTHIETALLWLNKRVEDRIEHGVLGTNTK